MQQDLYGAVLKEYFHKGELPSPLLLHSNYGDIEEMPIDIFFRDEEEFPELELIALALCDGKTLDVGAGAGAHSLYLQDKGFQVQAIDISERACQVMQARGVKHILHEDFMKLNAEEKYDTLLFLMNGIGIAQTIEGLKALLSHAKTLLSDKGQLLFDSSNIEYLYQEYRIPRPEHYFGEITFQYEYQGKKGESFGWLYIDQDTLIKIARELGWVVQILFEDDQDQYLVRMEPIKTAL